ncbi:hypothetical protein OCK74_05600 [Chitinophagaceae bacterium LB-8]|uniref:Outer membrane protein beta-barrel domain-containing protein n=1 Tax=Paraflavisolibacter caeni TaxID=2982496 RepID=A0A9X2XTK6_9BACT|nr:hypothetical protein [Paraflavisolibacter caeni]MCU7548580.1 hypothetical protein [Paraflavisolibacter caeni]
MIKQLILLTLFIFVYACLNAQKGNNGLSINGEVTVPFYQNDQGFGFFMKGLYGIGKSAQLTASIGVSKFKNRNSIESKEVKTRLIPFLVGYQQNIRKFYIEPKIGIGEMGGRILSDGDYARPSVVAVFGGLGAGYRIKRFNAGISFLTAHGIDKPSAGLWYNENFHYTSLYIGYDLFSK